MEASGAFTTHEITRRACTDDDVVIDVRFAGICHSDIHQVRQEWYVGLGIHEKRDDIR
jgi:D-arabinose 1-dehydrogenase-like Zn-dependent alcohol dehydrogenase